MTNKPHRLKEPNSLNFFKLRKLKRIPPHFEFISLPQTYNLERSIEKWIMANLKGRYYIDKNIDIDDRDSIQNVLKIGFEEGKEMSYFTLACPHLKYK